MEEVDRLKDEFLTLLSHETRTPLTQIMTPAEVFCGDTPLSEEERQCLGKIVLDAARSLEAKLEDVQLSLSFRSRRNETGDLRSSLADVVENSIRRLDASGAELAVHGEGAPWVDADPRHLQIAFERLIDDTRRSMPEGERLRVTVETAADRCTVLIDTDRAERAGPRVLWNPGMFEVSDVDHHSGQIDLGVPLADSILTYYGGRLRSECYPRDFRVHRVTLPRATSEGGAIPAVASGNKAA